MSKKRRSSVAQRRNKAADGIGGGTTGGTPVPPCDKAADAIGGKMATNEAEPTELVTEILLPVHSLNPAAPQHGHIETQLNSRVQRKGMRRLFDSLVDAGANLENGRPIASYADMIKYIAELAGSAA